MMLVDLTSTPGADLPLAPFKAHLKLGRGFTDDALQDDVLESYLRAAIAAIEARTGKVVLSRRVAWTVTRWAERGRQSLPVAPVLAIESIVVTARAGEVAQADLAQIALQPDTHRPCIVATSGHMPPIPDGGTATLTLEVGYAATWEAVPADLREAIFLLAASYYEHRSDTSGANGLMPFGVMALLEPYRNIRLMGSLA